jgi:hypothetical protein
MKTRKLISWISFLSFIVLGLTGMVLYFTPQGRIANWADWRFLQLSKDNLGEIHVIVSILFLISAIWHIVLNWRPLVNYLKSTRKKISFAKAEFVLALFITLVFALGAYWHIPPFGTTLNALAGVKTHWENVYGSPPWGHAELASVKSFTKKMGFDLERSIAILSAEGYQSVSAQINLLDLSRANKTSPKAIMTLLQIKLGNVKATGTESQLDATSSAPSGLGRLSLAEMANKAKVDVDQAIQRLSRINNITATAEMKVKEIAAQTGETPMDLWDMIKREDL